MNNKQINILIVEDNPGDSRLIQEMLSETKGVKFDLKFANRISKGIEYILEGGMDIILLDLSLPDSRGLDTFISIYEKAKEIPIIVLTAIDDETLAIETVKKGAEDYLVKGKMDGNLLLRSIRYAIERKNVEKSMRELQENLAHTKKKAAIGTLVGGIAHTISNPLTVIIADIQMIKNKLSKEATLISEELKKIVERMDNASQRIKKTISDLLFFTREHKLELKPVDIKNVVKESLANKELKLKGIEVIENYEEDLPQIPGNPDKLTDGFFNIIKNACEAMPRGGTLKIEAREKIDEKEKKEFVEIKFIDNGCGIPEDKIGKIFDPFFSTKDMGTGLGLSITRGIIEVHNGDITVESRYPKPLPTASVDEKAEEFKSGTTVTVRLPVIKSE